jgi:hypothetical protein
VLFRSQVKLNDESVEFAWVDKSNLHQYDIVFENDIAIEKLWGMKT